MKPFNTIQKYLEWEIEYFGRPPVYPLWSYRIRKKKNDDSLRHFIGKDRAVIWEIQGEKSLPHYDHVEMSGFYASAIISYGANKDGSLALSRHCIFPMLRKIPNNTGASLSHNFSKAATVSIKVSGKPVKGEYPARITIDSSLKLECAADGGIRIERKLFPSRDYPALIEKITLKNSSDKDLKVEAADPRYSFRTKESKGVEGVYELQSGLADENGWYHNLNAGSIDSNLKSGNSRMIIISPGSGIDLYMVYCAVKKGGVFELDASEEEAKRERFAGELAGALVLETPEEVLDTAFEFAKRRACESIFKTKNGLMHAPGGGSFYAALWTNDQCEYVNPFFPFVGFAAGNEEAINCFSLYIDRMDESFQHALVSSIIAEGEGYWNGAGDRGDAAMFAYGAARFSLAYGDPAVAERLWKGIEWAIEYSIRKKNRSGVIASDSDELENRFESGDANLFTSSLLYDALNSAVYLGKELGKPRELMEKYRAEADLLKAAIEKYFGARVEGFDTYRYYKGNELLRAWICIPLAMGIYERAEGTIKALFSDKLWSADGLRTQSTNDTFWDRATLYALRGVFSAGSSETALKHLLQYSRERLLGEHVPYALEAYPEGNGAHLSAESGLYCRIFTEGLFGIRPTGFRSFELKPQLPGSWNSMSLRKIKAFGSCFDIQVTREDGQVRVVIVQSGRMVTDILVNGSETIHVEF